MRALIITSCSKRKLFDDNVPDNNKLFASDKLNDNWAMKTNNLRAQGYETSAYNMYVGKLYRKNNRGDLGPIKEAFEILDNCKEEYNHYYLSAGYGIIERNESIVPYDISFAGTMIKKQTCYSKRDWANDVLKVNDTLENLVKKEDDSGKRIYVLIIFVLSTNYTKVVDLGRLVRSLEEKQKILYIDNPKNISLTNSKLKVIDPSGYFRSNYTNRGIAFKELVSKYDLIDIYKLI